MRHAASIAEVMHIAILSGLTQTSLWRGGCHRVAQTALVHAHEAVSSIDPLYPLFVEEFDSWTRYSCS